MRVAVVTSKGKENKIENTLFSKKRKGEHRQPTPLRAGLFHPVHILKPSAFGFEPLSQELAQKDHGSITLTPPVNPDFTKHQLGGKKNKPG